MATHPWDVKLGIDGLGDGPRPATGAESKGYLIWLAERRGIILPASPAFDEKGIWSHSGNDAELLLSMPGYGENIDVIECEELDESGNVIRSSRIGLDRRGKLPFNAAAVHKMTGLAKVKAVRGKKAVSSPIETQKAASPFIPTPIAAAAPVAPVPAASEAKESVMAPSDLSATVAALVRRVEMLERANGAPVYDRRACPARARMLRAYLQMRRQRAALASQLAASRARVVALEDAAGGARADRDRIRAKRARTASRLNQMRRTIALHSSALDASNAAYFDLTREADAMRGDLVRLQPLANALAALVPAAPVIASSPVADPVPPRPALGLVDASGRPWA